MSEVPLYGKASVYGKVTPVILQDLLGPVMTVKKKEKKVILHGKVSPEPPAGGSS